MVAVQQGDTLALGRLPSGNSLHMTSVRIVASRAAFAAYNASYWASRATAPPNATVYTVSCWLMRPGRLLCWNQQCLDQQCSAIVTAQQAHYSQ